MSKVVSGIAAIQRSFAVVARKPIVAVTALAAGSFLLAIVLRPSSAPPRFVSPDEAANYFFASTFANTGRLWAAESLNTDRTEGVVPVAPRSIAVSGGRLLPMSFLGLPFLAGLAGRIAGPTAMVLIVPLATAGAAVSFFVFLRRIWGGRTAFAAALLFLSLPAVIHYASRPMMHNLLFLDFLVIGAGFCTSAYDRRPWFGAFAGLSIGLALLTRTSEAPWVLLVLLVTAFWTRDRWRHWVAFGVGLALPLTLLAAMNTSLYGAPLNFGYQPELSEDFFETGVASTSSGLVAPFGIHLSAVGEHLWQYVVTLTPAWAALFLLGLGSLVLRWWRRDLTVSQRRYLVLGFAVSLWLFLVYGSWTIVEHTNPLAVILSSSYLRYWLPAFAVATPFVWIGIESLARGAKAVWLRVGVLLALIVASWSLVIGDDVAGLRALQAYASTSAQTAVAVEAVVPSDAVTFVQPPSDRVLFPERRVILVPVADPTTAARSAQFFATRVPIFVFIGPSQEEFQAEMEEAARLLGAGLIEVGTAGDGTLYRLNLI